MSECPAKRHGCRCGTRRVGGNPSFKKKVGNISPSVHLSKSQPGEWAPVRKMSPSCPLGYPHLVDNSICFPHSYPQYVDNSGFFGFLIHSEQIRACRVISILPMRRFLQNLIATSFVKWHRYYGFSRYTTHRRAGEAWRRAILGTMA